MIIFINVTPPIKINIVTDKNTNTSSLTVSIFALYAIAWDTYLIIAYCII